MKDNTLTLLIICTHDSNYLELFKDVKIIQRGKVKYNLKVEQAPWNDIQLTAYSDSQQKFNFEIVMDIRNQKTRKTISPDFIVVRNIIRGLVKNDFRNMLYGFKYANIPCLNSIDALINFIERPVVHGELKKIQKRLGPEKFPLISQTYYPVPEQMNFTPSYPLVVKVGWAEAGFGKIKLDKHQQFQDLKSILHLHGDYCTAERFIESEYDTRIQCIGNHIRAYKRISTKNTWKGNQASAELVDIPVTETYKLWCNEVKKMYGGLDIFAIDGIFCKDEKKEYILEVNDSTIGLGTHSKKDMQIMKDLIIKKMEDYFCDEKVEEVKEIKKEEVDKINYKNEVLNLKDELESLNKKLKKKDENYEKLMNGYKYLQERINYSKRNAVLISLFVSIVVIVISIVLKKYLI